MKNRASTVLLLSFTALAHAVWAAPETDQCSEGTYRNSVGECVNQCPCGYYGSTYSRTCSEGSDLFFNQTQVNFRLTARETSDTPILSAVLYIDKKIANKAAFELDISRPYFHSENVFYWNYFDTPRFRLQAAKFEGNRSLIFNVSSDISECSTGTRTFVMVPVKVYALSLVGSFYIIVYARGPSVNRNPYYVDAEGLVDSGCRGDLNYVLTSRECVESCPCGTYQLFGSCETSSAVSSDSLLSTVHVLPTTKPGSIVANLTLLIDEAALNSSYYMIISKFIRLVYHNDSGWISPHISSNINPLFELISSAPDVVVSDDNRLIFNTSATYLSRLRMASPVKCVTDSTRYVAVSYGLRLLSDSLYHLGDHSILIKVGFHTKSKSYFFNQYVRLTVEAECPDSFQLYDFVHHRCVSSCSCGYTPFRSHTTAYCEAAVEYQPSDFHDDRQTVLVHHSTETVSSSILLYVNLNSRFQDSQPIAHLEISSYLNQPAEVFFTQPDGTLNSTVDIVLNSSLDFSYCYDQLRNMNHTLYSVPIVVIPHPFGPANHQHTIRLTHHSPNSNRLPDLLYWYCCRESLDLIVNKTGTHDVLAVAVGVPVGLVGGVVIITAVVITSVVGLKIYRKRKGEQFGRFHNDEDVICKQVSTIDDKNANAGEEIENFNTKKIGQHASETCQLIIH